MPDGSVILAWIIGGGGLAVSLITAWNARKKVAADTLSVLSDSAMKQVDQMMKRLDQLQAIVDRLTAEGAAKDLKIEALEMALGDMKAKLEAKDRQIERLLEGVATLCTQVRQQGQEPWWDPTKKRGEGGI
jgi:predicted  nucleic acid-binding Zn-ribbon protein